jgi:hypothetical protein
MKVDTGAVTLIVKAIHTNEFGGIALDSSLEGSLRNDTPFDIEYVDFEVVAFNEQGQDLRMCDRSNLGSKCEFHLFHSIKAGETIDLTAPGNTFRPSRPVPKGQRIASLTYQVLRAPHDVKYEIIVAPVVDKNFSILPVFTTGGIALEVKNTASDVVEIAWDQSVYIDETGTSSRLIRGNVRLIDKDRPQPNTIIPPGTNVKETVFPIDRITQGSDGLSQKPLLPAVVNLGSSPTKNMLPLLEGKEIKLFLRILVNDQRQNITIPFTIKSVRF